MKHYSNQTLNSKIKYFISSPSERSPFVVLTQKFNSLLKRFNSLFTMRSQEHPPFEFRRRGWKSPDGFTWSPFFSFSFSRTVIACRPIPNDKKYTGHMLSIQRNCVCFPLSGGRFLSVGCTPKRIVQRPGELILFRCRLTWHLAARWTAIAVLIGKGKTSPRRKWLL